VEVVAVGRAPVEAHRILPDEEHVPAQPQPIPVQDQIRPDHESEVLDRVLPVGHFLSIVC